MILRIYLEQSVAAWLCSDGWQEVAEVEAELQATDLEIAAKMSIVVKSASSTTP
jgi:hypothetical protein